MSNSINLKNYNTFGISASCNTIYFIKEESDLKAFFGSKKEEYYILGGGSNILLLQNIDRYILKNEIKGIEIIHDEEDHIIVRVGSGENWHEFVLWSITKGYSGLENLSLIPGTVGAAPVQNIGAYGVEQDEFFVRLEGIDLENGKQIGMNKHACEFKYRDSIFKKSLKGNFFITRVHYKLNKKFKPNSEYGDISKILFENSITSPTVKDISDAIIQIRKSKLPDPNELGNAGSFFKNPIILKEQFSQLIRNFVDMPFYELNGLEVKIPAAWLIEQCGFKGFRQKDVGCHKKQALVLVNYSQATGMQVLELAEKIISEVSKKFGIQLDMEVNVWN